MTTKREKRAESLAKAESIAKACAEVGIPLEGSDLQRFDRHLEDAKRLAVEIQADEARSRYSAVIAPRADDRDDLGKWLIQETRVVVPTASTGAALDPTRFYNAPIAALQPQSVFLQSGVNVIQLDSGAQSLTIPYFSANGTAAATSAGTAITASDSTAGTVVARPRSYKVRSRVANEVLEDLTPETARAYANSLVAGVSAAIDAAFFEGSGSGENITGIKNVSNIGGSAISTNGSTPTSLDFLSLAFQSLRVASATPRAIAMHPRTWGTIERIKALTSGSNEPLVAVSTPGAVANGSPLSLFGVPVWLTTAIGTAEAAGTSGNICSSVYVYDAPLLHTIWRARSTGDAAIRLDAVRDGETDSTDLIASVRVDLAVPQPSAIVRVSGITA